jgi:POT family proton-dependent oligopeptide transporter
MVGIDAAGPAAGDDVLGHPRGLVVLAATEGFERFSYYGMQALLVLYMTGHLLQPTVARTVLGFGAFRGAVESVFGALTPQALATQIFGLYTGFVYVAPILGSFIGDHWIGRRRSVVVGLVLMACGHIAMSFEASFLIALALLLVGGGLTKGNIAAQVSSLYAPTDTRRDQAFSIFVLMVNIGGFLSPLVCGTLGEVYGWHYGFATAGAVMLVGVGIYVAGGNALPPEPPRRTRTHGSAPTTTDWSRVRALAILVLVAGLFWVAQSQIWNVYPLWVRDRVARAAFGMTIPVTWFQSIDALGAVVLAPVVVWIWRRQAARGVEPRELRKLALGCGLFAASVLWLSAGELIAGAGRVPLAWALAYHFLSGIGYLYFAPVVIALVSRVAPPHLTAVAISIYYLSIFAGSVASGWLGRFYGVVGGAEFWAIHAALCASGMLLLLLAGNPLRRVASMVPISTT